MKIHHSAICVDDIAVATDWYRSIMDFEVEYQDESWALLSFENSKVATFEFSNERSAQLSS